MAIRKNHVITLSIASSALIAIVLSCSNIKMLERLVPVKPDVSISNVAITGLSFSNMDLVFDFAVKNPNPFGISLSSFVYDVSINNSSLMSGDKKDKLEVPANRSATVSLPVNLKYADVFNAVSSAINQDSSEYTLKGSLGFNLPILGPISVPVTKTGFLPILKLPTLKVQSLNISKLTLTGADLILKVAISNTNHFGFDLNTLAYKFSVNGADLVSSALNTVQSVTEHNESVLKIPFSLNFLQVGKSVYTMISGNTPFNYNFTGAMNVTPSLKLIGPQSVSFDKSGQIAATR